MTDASPIDDALLRRLPLPLAQLYRRAHNAKTSLERHLAAYYLWEASLKLLASVAVVEYAERGPAAPDVAERLRNLARPALGHWWQIARLVVAALADAGDPAFVRLRDVLLGKPRPDCPRAAGLDVVLCEVLEGKKGARATVQMTKLFDRLVSLRNDEVGHGAAGQRPRSYYERTAPALLAGIAEVLDRLDVLAGRRLIHVADVRRLASGAWLVERYDLSAGAVDRLESLEVPEAEAACLPRPGRLYVSSPGDRGGLRMLHPLLVFDPEAEQVFFLNARVSRRQADYLCYTTGDVVRRDELGQDQRELLARILGSPVDAAAVQAWAEQSQADDPTSPPGEQTRRTVGEFELVSRLGRGGMGVVYRAWQPSLGRQVALKCLLRSGDPKAEARFAREIHALGKVDHPHLVKVFTSGSDGDQWFYAMELVEGADLAAVCTHLSGSKAAGVSEADWQTAVSTVCERQRQQEQPLDAAAPATDAPAPAIATEAPSGRSGRAYVARVVEVLRQTSEAAHALHEAGVVHRDIKPGNVMLNADGGHAVLLDLGLAQLSDEEEGRLTKTRQFVGTLRYASPEQLVTAKLDRRADVYSLGATLWELLTLRPLYGVTEQTPTPELMLKIQTSEPEHVRKHNPQVSADLDAIVMKCLEKDRARRYTSAAELSADLGRWQRGEAVQAQPPSLRYLLGKQLWRYRAPLTVTAAVLMAAVIGVVMAFVQINDARNAALKSFGGEKEARGLAETKEKETKEALTREKVVLARQKQLLSEAARTYAEVSEREFEKGNVDASVNWALRSYETAPQDDPLRPGYLRLLAAQGQRIGRPFHHPSLVRAVAFSPDGRTVLTGSSDGMARLWEAASGKVLAVLTHEGTVETVAFSPDGRTLVTGSHDRTARLWDAATGKPLVVLPHHGTVWAVAFSPDGGSVLTGSSDGLAQLWDAVSGKARTEFDCGGPGFIVFGVTFSPDGRTILTGGEDQTARLWEAATGKELAVYRHDAAVSAVAFSPDGRSVLTGSRSGTARLWEVSSGKAAAEFRFEGIGSAVAVSPDGCSVLTGSWDGTARLWDAATGKELAVFHHEGPVNAVAFSPEGRAVLTGSDDKTARLWQRKASQPLSILCNGSEYLTSDFSTDGRAVVIGSKDKPARLYDTVCGKPLAQFGHEAGVSEVAISPDGRAVLTAGDDRTARLWDAATGKVRTVFRHDRRVGAMVFSRDGRLALTGSDDQTVKLWDTTTGKELAVLRHEGAGTVRAVAFSPDGRSALTGSEDQTARLWDTSSGKLLAVLHHEGSVLSVAFSPDGRTVLTTTNRFDQTALLWDVASGKELAVLSHETLVSAGAFSPDSRTLLTGSQDRTARLWDAMTGKALAVFRHEGLVWSVAFSPDGQTVLTGSDDKTARLWDVATGKTLAVFHHEGLVWKVAFSSDGRTALTSDGKTARRWALPQGIPDEPARVRAWVQVRSAMRFSDDGRLITLTPSESLEQWRQLEAQGGDWQEPEPVRTWHLGQATHAEAIEQWFAATFHLRRLLAEEPGNIEHLDRLGAALSRAGHQVEAIERLSEAVRKRDKDNTAAARLLLVMARVRLSQQLAAMSAAGFSATPHVGPLLIASPLLAHAVVRQQMPDAIRQIEERMSLDQRKEERWQRLREEAETMLKPSK